MGRALHWETAARSSEGGAARESPISPCDSCFFQQES
jgi:hypothetical protein